MDNRSVVKTAAAVLLVGWVFAFARLPFAGIDLLIDAVGYVLVFNGLRALARLAGKSPWPARVALALAAVCAVWMFMQGTVADWLEALRYLLEAVLYVLAIPVVVAAPAYWGRRKMVIALRSVMGVAAGGSAGVAIVQALWSAGLWSAGAPASDSLLLPARAALLLCVAFAYWTVPRRPA